ncbi:Protein SUPPRESSOR OF npr1-1, CONSTITUTIVE 1, partial [Mucuna pruriens]
MHARDRSLEKTDINACRGPHALQSKHEQEVPRQERNLIPMSVSCCSTVASPPLIRYDVFLNFRGEDTRDNLVSHLRAELDRKNIVTFMDDRLGRGQEISPALLKAIQESCIYVLIFSPNYASSTWCLDELTKILDCKKRYGRYVIPVFYKVTPSIVRNQRERYGEALAELEDRFMDKVLAWKAALTQAAGFSGWDSHVIRREHTLVAEIVKDILKKLNRPSMSDHQGIIGIENHIASIQSLLNLESPSIRIIGIWGTGGIGKTTIATQIYHKLALQFGSSSLVLNVQEEIERHGVWHIKEKYTSELLEEGKSFSYKRLKRSNVLLILDDANNSGQLKDLIGGHDNFGEGSRIIVTSRDMQVLKNADADEIYEVKEMNFQDSLKLFSLNAFKQNHPPSKIFMELSVKVLNYAKGIPLALKVLGSLLYGRTREAWESQLQKLEKLPDREIFNVLKLSFDGLDEEQKEIFLDIACFYRGHEEIVVAETLDSCDFSANIGMDVLKDKSIISVLEGRIVMHDLMQEMGQEIVRQECINNPGKRSRLWKHEEIYHVLSKNKGTDAIQCIFLDICSIKRVELVAKTFNKMDNLRVLQFYKFSRFRHGNVLLLSFLESLPDGLKFLRWDDFPQRSLPLNFCPENLVRLEMWHCHLEELWKPNQELTKFCLRYLIICFLRQDLPLPKLKRLDLSYSSKLNRIPDLSLSPNIEEIILSYCRSLTQVDSSAFLTKLNFLCLNGCVELTSVTIPSNILSRSSGSILLSNCRKLETFSTSRSQSVFDTSIHHSNKLSWLDLSNCESLTSSSFEFDLSKFKFLKRLDLGNCSNLTIFPEIGDTMENLTVLNLMGTAIRELPSSLCRLVELEELSLDNCPSLEIIPSSIGSLTKLCKLDLFNCKSLETFPSSIFKLKLTELNLYGCSMLRTFPEILEPAETFAYISLTKTAIKELPSSFNNLVGLRSLSLNMCSDLESLPDSIANLNLLSELDCSGCTKLAQIPSDIGRLPLLRKLSLRESGIVNLPESIAHISSLKSLYLSDCKKLECIPQLPPFLKKLLAFDCPSVTRVMRNSRIQIPPNSEEATFKFHFTRTEQLDPSARVNIADDAWVRITNEAYRSVFFCFPESVIPQQFLCRSKGRSVTVNLCKDNRLIGFALCVVFEPLLAKSDIGYGHYRFRYRLKFESDDGINTLPAPDELIDFYWKNRKEIVDQDHTILWKYNLESLCKRLTLCQFEIPKYHDNLSVKECGICPLYAKEKDDNNAGAGSGDYSGFLRFSKNDIEEPSGSKVA